MNSTGGLIVHYIYATQAHSPDYMIKNNTNYMLIKDHLGSIRAVVDASNGSVVQQLDYDEFGVVINDTNPRFQVFGYAGGIYDVDTKLVRFGARDYDAEIGRWTTKDPIGFDGGDSNIYGYVGNDPVNRVDPSGLDDTYFLNSTGGRSPLVGPTNGNWGGKDWSGGLGPNQEGPAAPPTDSADAAYQKHDQCYDKCGHIKQCDKNLVNDLKKLADDPKKWEKPPRSGTEKSSKLFRDAAILYFGGK